jgi:flagellar hook-associated protein 2
MATISSAGIGSGLDVNGIVTQLVALERKPINQLQAAASKLQTQLSSYGQLQAALAKVRDAASTLTRSSTWSPTKGSSTDSSAVGVTTGTTSPPGNYSISVAKLAASQSLVAATKASSTEIVGQGTLHIELGTWGTQGNKTTFTPKDGTTPVDITIGPGGDSLASIRDSINAAGAGVTASIVNDATGARLVVRSIDSGLENAFRITVTDSDNKNTDASGLSALAYDPSAGVTQMTQTVAAADASATINGLPITSASNTLTDVIDGLTLQLGGTTTTPVQVAVTVDKDAVRKSIDDFVTAYNDLVTQLGGLTKYDAASKTAGALQGDRAAVNLQTQLRGLIGGTSGASTVFARLADIGLDPQSDGTLKVTGSKLEAAMGRLTELQQLFANSDALAPANDGFATRLRAFGDAALGTDGALAGRQEGLKERIDRNKDRQSQLEDRVAQIEKRLRAQYTALDAQMAQLTGLSNYVTQQLAAMNNYNKN